VGFPSVALEILFCHCKEPPYHVLKNISTANSMKVSNSHIIGSFMAKRCNRVFLCSQVCDEEVLSSIVQIKWVSIVRGVCDK